MSLEVRHVFLDMSKVFDNVWHDGLLFKLKQNGISGSVLKLLSSYLNERKQRVLLNGHESDWGIVESGVPQGSVLGPLLFLIYINHLEKGIKSKIKFFADDTSLFSIVTDPTLSAVELNHDLNLIRQWAHQWKMSFNPDSNKQAIELLFSLYYSIFSSHLSYGLVVWGDANRSYINTIKYLQKRALRCIVFANYDKKYRYK